MSSIELPASNIYLKLKPQLDVHQTQEVSGFRVLQAVFEGARLAAARSSSGVP